MTTEKKTNNVKHKANETIEKRAARCGYPEHKLKRQCGAITL